MALAASLLLFMILMGAISYYGYRTYVRPGRLYSQVGGNVTVGATAAARRPETPGVFRVLKQIGEKVPISPGDSSMARRLLAAAGYRQDAALAIYYGGRILLASLLVALAFFVRPFITTNATLGIGLLVGAGALGYFVPSFWLDIMVTRRQERIRFSLPDALDLLTIAVEAGLGLDQAMQLVSKELRYAHPDICDEFNLVALETRAGTSRADALRNLGRRTGERSVRQLTGIMIQSERFGTSMAGALRTHSEYLRVRRRQEAEERANKIGVKLVFPIFFFILPSMLVVSAGSGVLQLVKFLFPLMASYGQ